MIETHITISQDTARRDNGFPSFFASINMGIGGIHLTPYRFSSAEVLGDLKEFIFNTQAFYCTDCKAVLVTNRRMLCESCMKKRETDNREKILIGDLAWDDKPGK